MLQNGENNTAPAHGCISLRKFYSLTTKRVCRFGIDAVGKEIQRSFCFGLPCVLAERVQLPAVFGFVWLGNVGILAEGTIPLLLTEAQLDLCRFERPNASFAIRRRLHSSPIVRLAEFLFFLYYFLIFLSAFFAGRFIFFQPPTFYYGARQFSPLQASDKVFYTILSPK